MTTAYTSLLGLALPVTGELSGTWGDTVNNSITSLLDSAIAGTTTISADADVTLSTTTGAANTAREAILLWTANGTTTRNITAPAQSKIYTVINASAGTQSIVLRGAGPTTGVTILKGESALCAWNGSDFIKISNTAGAGTFTSLTVSGTTALNGNTTIGDAAADSLAVNATIGSNLIFTDNTYDIGASGATRPRNLYLGGLLTMGGALTVNGNVTLGDAAADTVTVNGTVASNLIFTDNTYDIGASGATRPRTLYLGTSAVTPLVTATNLQVSNIKANDGTAAITIADSTGAVAISKNLTIGDATTDTLTVTSTITSNLLFTDNTYDIGASGATRPRNLFLAGGTTIGTTLLVGGNTTINGGTVTLGGANNSIITGTSDAADTSSIRISGGGALSVDRGALIQAFGNENVSFPGHAYVDQGNVGSAMTYFRYGANVIGAQMDSAGLWTFNQAIGIKTTPDATKATLRVQGNSSGSSSVIRAQSGVDSRYRSDWGVASNGFTTFNAFDDTSLVYKDMRFDALSLAYSPNGSTTYSYFDSSGVRVSSNGSFTSLTSDQLIAAQMALMPINTIKTVLRITDTGNADFNVKLRSGASQSVTVGASEMQTNAYNMWLSTAGQTGALRITDTVNNGNAGQVTKPYSACFSAGLSASGGSQAVTANAALVFSNEFVDAGANYNTGNGRFTAPVTGNYWISAHVRWDNTNTANAYFSMVIYLNGGQVQRSLGDLIYMPASNYSYSTIGIVLALSAGDYVQAGTRQNSGTTFDTIPTECSFDGFLIG